MTENKTPERHKVSTENPNDYLSRTSLSEIKIGTGTRIDIHTLLIPETASDAWHRWRQHHATVVSSSNPSSHPERKQMDAAAAQFNKIMKFPPQELISAKENLQEQLGPFKLSPADER